MTTRARELRRVLDLPKDDPHCRCHGVPRGMIAADRLWAWSLEHPGQPPLNPGSLTPGEGVSPSAERPPSIGRGGDLDRGPTPAATTNPKETHGRRTD